jgi:glycosyltransferase involved in cell wall biosynthesis
MSRDTGRAVQQYERVVVIPAYNEAGRIEAVVRGVKSAAENFEVVVVDDGSSDGTGGVARDCGARVLRHSTNLGYGASLQTGYKFAFRAGARLVVQLDGDGQHDPADIPALAEAVDRGDLDLIVGSRFIADSGYRMGALQDLGRRLFCSLAGRLGLDVTDPTSGFQAFGPAVLELYVQDFFPSDYPDVDVLLAVHRSGLRIGEHPVKMARSRRPSTLHSGMAPIYYTYKMLLSLWVTSRRAPTRKRATDGEDQR